MRQLADPRRYGMSPTSCRGPWVQTEMLRLHVRRRLSEQLDGIKHGPDGSLDKLLMTWTEQAVGHAALARAAGTDDEETCSSAYLYSRAQSVMGGTSQIQKNIIAGRILELRNSEVRHARRNRRQADGPIRIITLNRPDELNAVNDPLHVGLAEGVGGAQRGCLRTCGCHHRCGAGVLGGRRLQLPR